MADEPGRDRTGEPWLLELATKIHRNTADWRQEGDLPNWHNVNIAQMAVGRDSDSAGGKAIGVLNLDGKVPAPALEALLAVDGIHAAKMIELPPRGKLPHWLA